MGTSEGCYYMYILVKCSHIDSTDFAFIMAALLVSLFDILRPGQQFFSHFGMAFWV